jgi:hypothetical protein
MKWISNQVLFMAILSITPEVAVSDSDAATNHGEIAGNGGWKDSDLYKWAPKSAPTFSKFSILGRSAPVVFTFFY